MNIKECLPLANFLRPTSIENFIGQDHLVSKNGSLSKIIEKKIFISAIFWGPPGVGKTTLARIIGNSLDYKFVELNATKHKTKDIHALANSISEPTICFLDEIHRFSKSQQDTLLPYVEEGKFILIGATTENPSFYVISPLLSRVKLFKFNKFTQDEIRKSLTYAISELEKNGIEIIKKEFLINKITDIFPEDIRKCYDILEMCILNDVSDEESFKNHITTLPYFSKSGDDHFEIISAIQKSIRSSDVDAAILYTMKMIDAGEDPRYILRRLVIIASEDIGNADPQALPIVVSAYKAFEIVGLPEGIYNIIQAVSYLALAPKSNSSKRAIMKAKKMNLKNIEIPIHLRNASTKLMKDMGYKKGYKYDHDYKYSISDQHCLPDNLRNISLYEPSEMGFEKTMAKRIEFIKKIKK